MFKTQQYAISAENIIEVAELDKENCTLNIFYKTERVQAQLVQEIKKFVDYLKNQPYIRTTKEQTFNFVEDIHFSDEFGDWSYQPLQDQIKILLQFPINQQYPEYIRLSNIIQPNHLYDETQFKALQQNEKAMKIEKFIEFVGKQKNIPIDKRNEIIDTLKDGQSVQTVDDLLLWNDQDWNLVTSISNTYKQYLKRELLKIGKSLQSNSQQKTSKAEFNALIHRIRRYLIWRSNGEKIDSLLNIGYLHNTASEDAFKEIGEEYQGPDLLYKLENYFKTFCMTKDYSKCLQFSRGIILYGPPGTGKTQLTSLMANLMGFTPIGPDICAADVNRGIVGLTELILRSLINRARKLPYLMCSLAIDEVDALAAKRDDKQSEHKTDHLTTLLGAIGGITDVPNITLFTSTNNFNKIDPAFSRRLSGSFFVNFFIKQILNQVGNPGPLSRKKILLSEKDTSKTLITEQNINYLLKLTTNFSGAAVKTFLSDILREVSFNHLKELTQETSLKIASEVAKQYRIYIGSYTLPQILQSASEFSQQPIENFKNIVYQNPTVQKHQSFVQDNRLQIYYETQFEVHEGETHLQLNIETFDLPTGITLGDVIVTNFKNNKFQLTQTKNNYSIQNLNTYEEYQFEQFQSYQKFNDFISAFLAYTGKIFIDCMEDEISFQFELKYKTQEALLIEKNKKLNNNASFDQKQISLNYLTNFCEIRNIDFIQLFDIEFFFQNNAFDESKQQELMNEKMNEIINYPKSLLIIDVDGLCLINENQSLSSMGISTSKSIQNQKMFNIIKNLAQAPEKHFQQANSKYPHETWVALITSNDFMKEQLKKSLNWPLTYKDAQQLLQQEEDQKVQKCEKCYKEYTNEKNDLNACQYHPGLIYQKSLNCMLFINEEIANQQKLKQHMLEGYKQVDTKLNNDNKSNDFVYSCCRNPEGSAGCKYGKHTNDLQSVLIQRQLEKQKFEMERAEVLQKQSLALQQNFLKEQVQQSQYSCAQQNYYKY